MISDPNTELIRTDNSKSYWRCASIISKVIKDQCIYTLFYQFDVFSHVDRIYPEDTYSTWKLLDDPDLVIDNIYLGSAYNAADYQWLKDTQIKTIVNATHGISNYYPSEFGYHRFAADDLESGSLLEHYDKFYEAVKDSSGLILVHCYAGRSRSAALVLYYLVKEHGMTVDLALEYLKTRRPIVNLNRKFIDEIRELTERVDIWGRQVCDWFVCDCDVCASFGLSQ